MPNILHLFPAFSLPSILYFPLPSCRLCPVLTPFPPCPSPSSYPRCDVGLEEGNIEQELSLCYNIVYYYDGTHTYEQFLLVGRLYRALILLGLALCFPSASVSSVVMALCRY